MNYKIDSEYRHGNTWRFWLEGDVRAGPFTEQTDALTFAHAKELRDALEVAWLVIRRNHTDISPQDQEIIRGALNSARGVRDGSSG